ncbi:MAG: AsmA family protein [Pseudomarimonas sp.]
MGLLLVAAGVGVHHLIQPERLGATLIRRAEAASGLRIELSSPARLSLWPRLNLQLDDLRVVNPADVATLLHAQRVEVALPLAVLWSPEPAIGRVNVHRADIDFDTVSAWWGADSEVGPAAVLRLPTIAVQLVFSESTLRVAGQVLSDLDLDLSAVRDGRPATLSASARFPQASTDTWHLRAEATPRQNEDGIGVEAIRVTLTEPVDSQELASLTGAINLELPHRLHMELVLCLLHPEQIPLPSLPAALQVQVAQPMALAYDGAGDLSDALSIHSGTTEHPLTFSTNVKALIAWANQDAFGANARSPLPPIQGTTTLPDFEIEGVLIEGLQVDLKTDAATPAVEPER